MAPPLGGTKEDTGAGWDAAAKEAANIFQQRNSTSEILAFLGGHQLENDFRQLLKHMGHVWSTLNIISPSFRQKSF